MAPIYSFYNFITFSVLLLTNSLLANGRDKIYLPPKDAPNQCETRSCYPNTGNLLIGRENRLKATSTCGLRGPEKYCIVHHLEEKLKCFHCDSRPQYAKNPLMYHGVENIVYSTLPGSSQKTWWQAENGKENVSLQLDLEAEFHFTHLIIKFKTFRPAAMIIERSYDFGKTWQVYRYFSQNCEKDFSHVKKAPQKTLTDIVCDSRYSSTDPSTYGEVIMRVLDPHLHHFLNDPYSREVQNLLKMTNLRINFTKLHTLGDDLLDNRVEIQQKYYYAITDMVVRGSCSCYGHASHCLPLPGFESKEDMVHGQCKCSHNTKGLNCESCEDFFNDFPWKPAFGNNINACKKCNCNNHATRCHFDQNVFNETGHTTGGVCDDCMHNTMGRNCEMCKPGYFHNPINDFSSSEACTACNCNPGGSLDDGYCDSTLDEVNGIYPGQCHCKTNIDGLRCDKCKVGFWNFSELNPDGCQKCTCDRFGTIGNEGCNEISGECECKVNVIGRDCNQCLPMHWGLSEIREGCKSCDCDIGGSIDGNCDVITGQCRCRPHVTGRKCDIPDQSYFSGNLDHLVIEAENAMCSDKTCQVTIKEPFRDPQQNTWTGPGFMRATPNTQLVFDIDDIKTSMDYDLVIRYEPQYPGVLDDVSVKIFREEPVDLNGPCGNSIPKDDEKTAFISTDARHTVVTPPVCLEKDKKYKVYITFKQSNNQIETPSASILVDSIVLVPRVENLPFFQNTPQNKQKLNEFEHYRCRDQFYSVVKGEIPEVCKKYDYSIGFYVYGGAFSCNCNLTGSTSTLCNSLGGKCQCKPNVEGRQCDRCAPGTYGFGPEGCKSCDCNSYGALDNFCDMHSGQCTCRNQTYGRECDQCQPGSWNYPNCQKCQCNAHADICHPHNGECVDCQAATTGPNCERCISGFYGDPRLGIEIPCRPCPCPGTADSGHSFADHCSLDSQTQDVVCECKEGYAGFRCDVCADNYFGKPEIPGGDCQPCNCNNNTDILQPGNCDPHTGKCLQCLFNTEGDNCEICKKDFYGDATQHSCARCQCFLLGTDINAGSCDRITGQCPCLPNVVGQNCNECKINHWKIASGIGCESCDCDPVGSVSDQCNLYTGQCNCKQGFGGRQCNQCQEHYYGDPNVKCYECECNPEGSSTLQCDQKNGTCLCKIGIGGEKCNTCARGFVGNAPICSPCGECFENWDRILDSLNDETKRVINSAKEIKRTGAAGAYTQQFESMENKLKDIEKLLMNTKKSSYDLSNLEDIVETIKINLANLTDEHNAVEKLLENTTQRIYLSNLNLASLRNKTMTLSELNKNLKENITTLQESNVEGALNLTREAYNNAIAVQDTAREINGVLADAERQCKRTDNLVNKNAKSFKDGQLANEESLKSINNEISKLEQDIPFLNQQVCDKRGDPCDSLCGGAGCGSCGGLSCEDGAVEKAKRALSYANEAETQLQAKEAKAEEMFRGISQAKMETKAANDKIKQIYEMALNAKNDSEGAVRECAKLADDLSFVVKNPRATPTEIRNKAADALSKNIKLKPEQINEIARKINESIASRSDINDILSDTAEDLQKAKQRKEDADRAKYAAEAILNKAKNVLDMLNEAKEAQDIASEAINKAAADINTARKDLVQTASETDVAQDKANGTVVEVTKLQERMKALQTDFLKNDKDAKVVADEVIKVDAEVKRAQEKAAELKTAYQKASQSLQQRGHNFTQAHEKAEQTFAKASLLFTRANSKLKDLIDAEKIYEDQETTLNNLSDDLDRLNNKITIAFSNIKDKSDKYRTCNS